MFKITGDKVTSSLSNHQIRFWTLTSEKEFTIAKNIDGFRLRARGTGEFSAKTINLEATLKKASALLGDGTTPDTDKGTTGGENTEQGGSGTTGGENTEQGGSGTTGEGGGDGLE